MAFNKSEAAILAGSTTVGPAAPDVGEIDLYDELLTFAGLSPDEQERLLAGPKESGEEAVAASHSDSDIIQNTSSSVEIEAAELQAENISGAENSVAGKITEVSPPLYDRSRTGPLLAGLNVITEFFAGDLSLGVCLSCGAESGADDLFCVSCGVFIDDIGEPPKSSPTCGECGQSVSFDEIFCPWCGAAPAA